MFALKFASYAHLILKMSKTSRNLRAFSWGKFNWTEMICVNKLTLYATLHPSVRKVVGGDFGGNPFIYLFALTEVVELNVPDDPCNKDPDYNFRKCLKESFMMRIGCRTKWDDVELKDLPLCATMKEFK